MGKLKTFLMKPPVLFFGGLFLGLMAAAVIVGISGAQLWASFKGKYFPNAAA